jgi:hypothetical protein
MKPAATASLIIYTAGMPVVFLVILVWYRHEIYADQTLRQQNKGQTSAYVSEEALPQAVFNKDVLCDCVLARGALLMRSEVRVCTVTCSFEDGAFPSPHTLQQLFDAGPIRTSKSESGIKNCTYDDSLMNRYMSSTGHAAHTECT